MKRFATTWKSWRKHICFTAVPFCFARQGNPKKAGGILSCRHCPTVQRSRYNADSVASSLENVVYLETRIRLSAGDSRQLLQICSYDGWILGRKLRGHQDDSHSRVPVKLWILNEASLSHQWCKKIRLFFCLNKRGWINDNISIKRMMNVNKSKQYKRKYMILYKEKSISIYDRW